MEIDQEEERLRVGALLRTEARGFLHDLSLA